MGAKTEKICHPEICTESSHEKLLATCANKHEEACYDVMAQGDLVISSGTKIQSSSPKTTPIAAEQTLGLLMSHICAEPQL